MPNGLLIVVSGPAGSGKGTVLAELLGKNDGFCYSVSATTRAPRPGERDGVNYFFLTRAEFEKRIAEGRMLEHTEYVGNYYGTPLQPVLDAVNFVFGAIMSREMGEMDYGEEEALHLGAEQKPERADCAVEFHLISVQQRTQGDDHPVKKLTAEARFVAGRIRTLPLSGVRMRLMQVMRVLFPAPLLPIRAAFSRSSM